VHLTTEALQHCEARGWVGFVSMADPAGLVSLVRVRARGRVRVRVS